MSEDELIILLKEGNEDAFSELVAVHRDPVYNTVLSIVQNFEDAEDLSQDVFIRVFHAISNFGGNAALSTWLYRIAVNTALDHLRKKKRQKRFAFITQIFSHEEVDTVRGFDHPGISLDRKENTAILFAALKKIPEKQQAAFVLKKAEGLSYREVAEVQGVPIGTVMSRLARARAQIKAYLDGERPPLRRVK